MEAYFKLRLILEFVAPVVVLGLAVMVLAYLISKNWFKSRLMKKLGYTYEKGLGNNVAYEFQPHWIKGGIKINSRKIREIKYSKIKSYVKSQEK